MINYIEGVHHSFSVSCSIIIDEVCRRHLRPFTARKCFAWSLMISRSEQWSARSTHSLLCINPSPPDPTPNSEIHLFPQNTEYILPRLWCVFVHIIAHLWHFFNKRLNVSFLPRQSSLQHTPIIFLIIFSPVLIIILLVFIIYKTFFAVKSLKYN